MLLINSPIQFLFRNFSFVVRNSWLWISTEYWYGNFENLHYSIRHKISGLWMIKCANHEGFVLIPFLWVVLISVICIPQCNIYLFECDNKGIWLYSIVVFGNDKNWIMYFGFSPIIVLVQNILILVSHCS